MLNNKSDEVKGLQITLSLHMKDIKKITPNLRIKTEQRKNGLNSVYE